MYAEKRLTKLDRSYARWSRSLSRLMGEIDYDSGLHAAKEDGRAEEKLEIARKLKARGRPLEEIKEDTGLTEAQIRDL